MSKTPSPIENSSLSYQEDGAPYCERFDDIYFDSGSGYQQSEYVFIEQNKIVERIVKAKQAFVIGETGFGTGLNFLLTLQAYQKAQQSQQHELEPLHFISVEKYPLSQAELTKSLLQLEHLAEFSELLVNQYPANSPASFPQSHTALFFQGKVKLTIHFNDAANALSSIKCGRKGLIDSWFLDGFSPSKNPDMWSGEVFSHIGRLTKDQATVTTFTVAGQVKRDLRKIGFRLEKRLSKGKKKEMFYGLMQSNPLTSKGYQLRPRIIKPQHVSIIGGGIASACLAYLLTKQGVKVALYCKDAELAQGGSSNAIGALYPLLHQQKDEISTFYQKAFWRARELYQEIAQLGFSFDHDWCGLLEVSYKEALQKRQQAFEEINAWPKELIHSVNIQQAETISGVKLNYGGLFMPNAGWVSPREIVKQLFNAAQKTNRLKVFSNTLVNDISPINNKVAQASDQQWQLTTNQGNFIASVLVICGGADSINIKPVETLPLSPTRGQVTSMKSNNSIAGLGTVICHKGYLTPKNNGIHCIGATFQKNDTNIETCSEDDSYNLNMLNKCLPELSSDINWQPSDIASNKARLRCMSQDHLPVVGAMPDIAKHIAAYPHLAKDKNWRYSTPAPVIDNLYILSGLGARGLCSAPLSADILTAELCNTPYPLNAQELFNLSPNRFVIRDIIKRKLKIEI